MSFDHLKSIYRDFDIRGQYPEELTAEEVTKIAMALTTYYQPKKVAIGRDIRPSADELFSALTEGFLLMGVDVVDLGLTTTPMVTYMCGSSDVDMAVMITASHMPSQFNGLKVSVVDGQPVPSSVLQELKALVEADDFQLAGTVGKLTTHSLKADWINNFSTRFDLSKQSQSVVIDSANMIGALEVPSFKSFEPHLTVSTIYEDFDHTCPNHEANPVKTETLADLGAEVVNKQATLGIAFDGDADRVGFVNELGVPVPSDIIGILLAQEILKERPGATIVCDIRSTEALIEEISRLGGTPVREKVGHTHIRKTMRELDADLGIELSGHFFFKDSYFSEGGALPAFIIMQALQRSGQTLSELTSTLMPYHHSGEINSEITQTPDAIYNTLNTAFPEAKIDNKDGLTLKCDNWWCNVRPSANDPVMRLNLEADNKDLRDSKVKEILAIIRSS